VCGLSPIGAAEDLLMIRRREFIAGLGATAAWPLDAYAQAPRLATIGFLNSGSPRAFAPLVAAYHEGMRELGYAEGRNIMVAYAWAEGDYGKLDALASDLVRRQVKLIVGSGGLVSARAAMKATATIPIVFISGFDPVEVGLVPNFNRPGGNATGVSLFTTELLPKQLQMLYELGPKIQTTGVLMNPGASTANLDVKHMMGAAQSGGYQLRFFRASTESEIEAAFVAITEQKVSALVIAADPFFNTRRDQIVALAAHHAMPVLYPWREYVDAGGLMSYGVELRWGYYVAGQYSARIIGGEKPGDLPVQQPTRLQLVINLRTARALGLAMPPNLLVLADEVIE
jgi:putative tryptophan/tyrosine transport system substrate-binding protein